MKKFYSFLGLAAVIPLLANCGGASPQIKINNKIDTIGFLAHTYQLEVEAINLGDAKLVYSSSATDVASVDDTGLIVFANKGMTTITVASSLNSEINDSFNLTIMTTYVEGTVTDENAQPIKGVHVSYGNEVSIDTNDQGAYSIPIEEFGQTLYFEKLGYLSAQYVPTIEQVYDLHNIDITLVSGDLQVVTIKGNLKNIDGGPAQYVNLSIKKSYNSEYFVVTSDEDGDFEFKDIIVGSSVAIQTFNNEYNSATVVIDNPGKEDVSITLEPYQEKMMFSRGEKDVTTGNDKMILGHVYRRDLNDSGAHDTLVFNLEATYPAFTEGNRYRICIDAGSDPASPLHNTADFTEDNNDFDIGFTSQGIVDELTKHYGSGKDFGSGSPTIKLYSEYKLDVEIPYDYANADGLKNSDESPIGVYFDSSLVSSANKCTIYGHSMTEQNQLSYIRLDENNVAYAATDNVNPDSAFISNNVALNWETAASSNWRFATHNSSTIIGQVGYNFNYGYQFKVAKRGAAGSADDTGIYILAKMKKSEMNGYFLENSWVPNLYIDSNADATYSHTTIDGDINRFAMISNYSVERSYPLDDSTPFHDTRPFLDETVYGAGVRYFTKRDLAIIYLPYAAITKADGETSITHESSFGLAPNLNYKSEQWYAFQGNNPTGYKNIPHFEERVSYIHFDKDLNILVYPS